MSLQTRRPEEDKEQQFTFTPHETTPPPVPPPVTLPVTPVGATHPTPDWRELRRQERDNRRAERHAGHDGSYRWIGGAVLILLGGLFLLQNTGLIQRFDNWWALFILIPALGAFATAWRLYQQSGNQWTSPATGSLLSGLILTGLVVMFLFGFNIGMWWPLFLIAGGIAVLLGARQRG